MSHPKVDVADWNRMGHLSIAEPMLSSLVFKNELCQGILSAAQPLPQQYRVIISVLVDGLSSVTTFQVCFMKLAEPNLVFLMSLGFEDNFFTYN